MRNINRITGRENRSLVRARKIRDGKERGSMFIEGRRLVIEALRSPVEVEQCFLEDNFVDSVLIDTIVRQGIRVDQLSSPLFRSISATEHSQGIIMIARRPSNRFENFNVEQDSIPVFLFLHEVNNPLNVGAILRSVEASGAAGVFISRNSADVFSAKALRAAMGSAFRVRVEQDADLRTVVGNARSSGVKCLGVQASAPTSYSDIMWSQPHLLVFGSEAHGLAEKDREAVGDGISIPMANGVESLNLAVAAGIVLFEARRQIVVLPGGNGIP